MDPLRVRLAPSFILVCVLMAPLSLGLLSLLLLWSARCYPRVIDELGIETRSGARYAWTQLRRVQPARGQDVWLHFDGGGRVVVAFGALRADGDLRDYLARCGVRTGPLGLGAGH